MLLVHVSDLVDGRYLEPEFIARLLAYVEAKTTYETLSKVLQLLYEARAQGLVHEKLVDIISDWWSEAEEEHRVRAELVDGSFKSARSRLERLLASLPAKTSQQAEVRATESI